MGRSESQREGWIEASGLPSIALDTGEKSIMPLCVLVGLRKRLDSRSKRGVNV